MRFEVFVGFDFVTVFTGGSFMSPSRLDKDGVRNIGLTSKVFEFPAREVLRLYNKQFVVNSLVMGIEFIGLNVELGNRFG
jgi:hypothetical protein